MLPDLEAAYARARSWTGASFDAAAVAGPARMVGGAAVPGQNSAEQIGDLIAAEYALLYETSAGAEREAAMFARRRPRFATQQAGQPDWERISRLLRQSYRELAAALATANVAPGRPSRV